MGQRARYIRSGVRLGPRVEAASVRERRFGVLASGTAGRGALAKSGGRVGASERPFGRLCVGRCEALPLEDKAGRGTSTGRRSGAVVGGIILQHTLLQPGRWLHSEAWACQAEA